MSEIQIETDSEWNPYQSHEETIESLRQQLTDLQNIHNQTVSNGVAGFEAIRQQLAECQATNGMLRNSLNKFGEHTHTCDCVVDGEIPENEDEHDVCTCGFSEALALPNDATALDELIAERTKELENSFIQTHNWLCDRNETISELTAEVDAKEVQRQNLMAALERLGNSAQGIITELRQQNAELNTEIKILKDCAADYDTKFEQYERKNAELTAQRDAAMNALIHIQQVACSGSPELGIASEAINAAIDTTIANKKDKLNEQ